MTTAGPGLGGPRDLGADSPGGRVGVLGEERDHVRRQGRSTSRSPRLRRRGRRCVSTIRTPCSARSTSRLSARISSTSRGFFPSSAASSWARGRRLDRGEVANASLCLRDDLLGDHDDVVVARLAGGRDHHPQRRALVDFGNALDRADLDQSSETAAAVSGARFGSSARMDDSASRSSGVSRSSASDGMSRSSAL